MPLPSVPAAADDEPPSPEEPLIKPAQQQEVKDELAESAAPESPENEGAAAPSAEAAQALDETAKDGNELAIEHSMKEFTAQSNPEECVDKMLSHVEAAREQVMQQFDELTQNIRSSIPRLNEIKDAVNNRKRPELIPQPRCTSCLSCAQVPRLIPQTRCMSELPGAGRAGRIDQLRRDVELAKTQQEQQSLIASYMSKLGGCAPNPLRPCPPLCCLLMRSPFAQHGSHVPERAPGHHSVIVATAPLLCPPPSRGAELNGASGSHGCGVFLRWVLRICADLRKRHRSEIHHHFILPLSPRPS